MPGARRTTEPLLYPPLSAELKARMRKAGHADMVLLLDEVSVETIKGLMRASQSGPVFKPKLAWRCSRSPLTETGVECMALFTR